jgi:hypothetical protein
VREYGGLLGALAEASDIQQSLGCSADEAFEIQRQLEAERLREDELAQAQAESNVIPFRAKH